MRYNEYMASQEVRTRFVPSSFDLSGDFELRPIPVGAPWKKLTDHIKKARPRAVLGTCPTKLQLDPRIYETVSEFKIPYLFALPRNTELACEFIRQMHIDLIVATRIEALELQKTMQEKNMPAVAWHIITSPDEKDEPLPVGHDVLVDIHEYPGMSV